MSADAREEAQSGQPVALDAMGGDRAPLAAIEGAIQACAAGLGPIILVGDEVRLRAELESRGASGLPIEVRHASEVIGMAEHPGRAARAKQDSSIHVGFRLVRDGEACGFVSAGNSGAFMAVALLTLRRIPRCDRPAIAGILPTGGDSPTIVLDLGANVECRAAHLVQFALMGAAYAEMELDRVRPTVGLLSNGVEPTKGTETLREAHRFLTQTDLNYVGFVEGRSLPMGGTDVVVTDGFVGNIALKLSEGIAVALLERLRNELQGDWVGALGARLMKGAFGRMQHAFDWVSTGGAALLGVDGIGVVAHGSSTPEAFVSAIALARKLASSSLIDRLGEALQKAAATLESQTCTTELPLTRIEAQIEAEEAQLKP
jgi:glycerol-3-phosphate acyltransferase PlsX